MFLSVFFISLLKSSHSRSRELGTWHKGGMEAMALHDFIIFYSGISMLDTSE